MIPDRILCKDGHTALVRTRLAVVTTVRLCLLLAYTHTRGHALGLLPVIT